MNKILLTATLFGVSFSTISAPYVGLEYGIGSTSHDSKVHFSASQTSPETTLKPSNEDGILSGFIGYSFTPSWALEVGYSQFNLNSDHSKFLGFKGDYKVEEEWESSVKAKQLLLTPVYTHTLNDKWLAKVKTGLTYTTYDVNGSHHEESEHIQSDDLETIKPYPGYSNSSNEVGGIIALGTEYKILPQLTVGVNAKYQFDSFATTTSFNLSSTYYF